MSRPRLEKTPAPEALVRIKELKFLPPIRGARMYCKCQTCGHVAYRDYTPFGLGNPFIQAPCGHWSSLTLHQTGKPGYTRLDDQAGMRAILAQHEAQLQRKKEKTLAHLDHRHARLRGQQRVRSAKATTDRDSSGHRRTSRGAPSA